MSMINGNLKTRETMQGGVNTRFAMSGNMTGGVGGTSDYEQLENLPSFNGRIIEGDKDPNYYGIAKLFNYSLQEQNTGEKWIDGKDIYVKTYTHNCSSGTGFQLISDDMLQYIDTLIKHETFVYYHHGQNDFYWYTIPYGVGGHADITYDYTGLFFHVKSDNFNNYLLYCTIYYTKE